MDFKEIKGSKGKVGYLTIALEKTSDGSYCNQQYIHRLIGETFIPNLNNYPNINHKDGNKLNNNVKNLEWCNASYNNQHAYDTNLKHRGEEFYNAKLTESQVLEILKLKGKLSQYKIAEIYNVTRSCILQIFSNRTWKHIKDNNNIIRNIQN